MSLTKITNLFRNGLSKKHCMFFKKPCVLNSYKQLDGNSYRGGHQLDEVNREVLVWVCKRTFFTWLSFFLSVLATPTSLSFVSVVLMVLDDLYAYPCSDPFCAKIN